MDNKVIRIDGRTWKGQEGGVCVQLIKGREQQSWNLKEQGQKGSRVPEAEPGFSEGRRQREGVGGHNGEKTQRPGHSRQSNEG